MNNINIDVKSSQERQDEIFKKMSADRKIEVASQLWKLAKELDGDKINYGTNRSKTPSRENRQNP